jgi:hypothetical protein
MSFGEHLKQFALSIDFIDSGHYELVQQQIKKYLSVQIEATQVALFEKTRVDDRLGITTVWSYPNFRIHQTLHDENGDYRRQLALAIGENRNLWVISDSGHLDYDNRGTDIWGEVDDPELPPFYVATNALPSRTAIALITKNAQGYANGAFLIEISKVIRPSKVLRREMQLIADAVGLLHATDVATQEQREGTTRAIATLSDLVSKLELDTGPKPLMFVASSSRAPEDITSAMDEVLSKFDDHVFVEPWHRMHQPGNINLQLVEKIGKAQYGVCYMSEEVESDQRHTNADHRFKDNPNVLVEAGMLHMVTATDVISGTGWIPIRETDSPEVPFDLGNQRMVLVERNSDGEANIEAFKEDLTAKIESLLEAEPTHSPSKTAAEERKDGSQEESFEEEDHKETV